MSQRRVQVLELFCSFAVANFMEANFMEKEIFSIDLKYRSDFSFFFSFPTKSSCLNQNMRKYSSTQRYWEIDLPDTLWEGI